MKTRNEAGHEWPTASGNPSHTPTFKLPLAIVGAEASQKVYFKDANREDIGSCYNIDNAAFIVRAVNAHGALVEACRESLVLLKHLGKKPEDFLALELLEKAVAQEEGRP